VNPEPYTPGAAAPGPVERPGVAARARRGVASALARARGAIGRGAGWLWARRPPRERAAAVVFCALAAALGVHGIVFQARLASRLPAPRDWAALRALVERDARAGDAVALSPGWAERAREVLPPGVPVLPSVAAGEDLPGVRRVWLVSLPEAPGFGWEPELALLERARRSDPPQRLGALEVRRYELAFPALPLAFLPDRIAQAEVSVAGERCAARPGGFRCGGEGLLDVVRTVREVDGVPRPCLSLGLAAPPPAPVVISFPAVPLGRTVRAHLGAAGGAAHREAPVRVAILAEGEEVGAAELGGPGFPAFEADTARLAGRFGSVSLVVTASGPAGDLCLDAVVLP
jgi:hypothetical protein